MSTTTAAPRRPRPAVSPLKQGLRLTRTEFTLFVRYKTAWMYLVLPPFFAFMAMNLPNNEIVPGFGTGQMAMVATIGSIGLILGVGHPSNVFTARREALVLKRLRVSGVPQQAIFGGVIAVVVALSLAMAVVVAVLVFAVFGSLPQDPLMLVVAVVLSAVMFSLMGLLLTPVVRNAEAAQMVSMLPMMVLLFLGGGIIPLESLPESARLVLGFLPSVPAGEMAQTAYSGYDAFRGFGTGEEKSYLGLWIAALPSIGVMLAWIAVLGLLVRRYFRWDPRQP
ncbi:ABC transporter [Nocardiopsis sp. TSRI0078]|uniref:ABC transporter permease n=1 Tax=unclassified Nocardiopsis TaxID=2649073 RepID=UPI00093A7EB7|nr:ABC transporter permease [Nocardiopsis sp. TSRI0078]OKI13577.1 ABC transporter [Nocardiopsis sp. TSRI0078]